MKAHFSSSTSMFELSSSGVRERVHVFEIRSQNATVGKNPGTQPRFKSLARIQLDIE